jgi:hypothetical protein
MSTKDPNTNKPFNPQAVAELRKHLILFIAAEREKEQARLTGSEQPGIPISNWPTAPVETINSTADATAQ